MTENPKGRVTITLGRSGQVVKRGVTVSDVDYSDSMQVVGSKRSVKDRLGSNYDCLMSRASSVSNKRQRGGSSLTSLCSNDLHDDRIRKDDLRFKLLQKDASKGGWSTGKKKQMDLREKLSKPVQHLGQPAPRFDSRSSMPEPKQGSMLGRSSHASGSIDLRPTETSRNSYSPWTLDHISRRSPDRPTGNSRFLSPPKNLDDRNTATSRFLSPPRYVDDRNAGTSRFVALPRYMDNRTTGTSRFLIPSGMVDEQRQRPFNKPFDDLRSVSYMSKDSFDPSRSGPATFVTNSATRFTSVKTAAPPTLPSQLPPLSGIAPNPYGQAFNTSTLVSPVPIGVQTIGSQTIGEHQTVEGLLNSLGLGKYAITFRAEEVDLTALKQMGERDLKELGIPMGPRKKILLALMPPSKRQP